MANSTSQKFQIGQKVSLAYYLKKPSKYYPKKPPEIVTEVRYQGARWCYRTTGNFGRHPTHWLAQGILKSEENDSPS